MAWYEAFMVRMQGFGLPTWEGLPDLGLYMDQVITFLERQYKPVYGEAKRIITPSMINNYVKGGLVTRPVAKKYDREQIAQLLIVCGLKQVLSIDEMKRLLACSDVEGTKALYSSFCGQVAEATRGFEGKIQRLDAMECAVKGASYSLLCSEILREEDLA